MPWLDNWLVKNPLGRIGPPSFDAAGVFAYQQIVTRKADKNRAGVQSDFLDDFLDLGGDDINFVLRGTFTHVRSWTLVKQAVNAVEKLTHVIDRSRRRYDCNTAQGCSILHRQNARCTSGAPERT